MSVGFKDTEVVAFAERGVKIEAVNSSSFLVSIKPN